MVNNRMIITFEEPKTLDEAFTNEHVMRKIAYLQEENKGYVIDRYYTSGYEMTEIDGMWFTWYRKVVLYINDNYVGKIMREIKKPYYVR